MTDTVDLPAVDPAQMAALPDGITALARELWTLAGHTVQVGTGHEAAGCDAAGCDSVDRHLQRMLFAPLALEPDWPPPSAPVQVAGGFVHAESLDEDQTTLDAVLAAFATRGPEAVAAAAQELRLPVSPYRRRVKNANNPCSNHVTDRADPEWASGTTVIDLSTHWAGPLATALLADAGARVIKVDPACRPDGFRARRRLYGYLNGSKEIVDLDLRVDRDRNRFEGLLTSADLVVESFSRRVMANLGYGHDRLTDLSPTLRSLAIRAFPVGSPEQDWIGYGSAIHAIGGMGYDDSSIVGLEAHPPSPATIAYPDFLAGLTAYGEALQLLHDARSLGRSEVSLMCSIAPLLPRRATEERSDENQR